MHGIVLYSVVYFYDFGTGTRKDAEYHRHPWHVQKLTSLSIFEREWLSKNFSFWTVSLDLDSMFKIKSLLYKDLILNSWGCRKSNQLLRHPHRCCVEPPPFFCAKFYLKLRTFFRQPNQQPRRKRRGTVPNVSHCMCNPARMPVVPHRNEFFAL